ncbi:hypothetical protein [Rubrivirga marina]|uniref:Peptidase S9 prolyl oligopeptidase catalytic domain-containing protein n=1 Tax=Rubrivirga marina TaxID=1196024 RepID=A0A271J4W9_9BACT|nr:hypothetical protein [Rubrivirga marina]PAP78348.1 hypothetical protein BSZ37_18935 [Rubrivirga marina]
MVLGRLPLLALLTGVFAGSVMLLAGCSESPPVTECVPAIDPDCETPDPGEDEVVAGVNLTDLFETPTAPESDAALAIGVSATDGEPTVTELRAAADGSRQFLLAYDFEGERIVTALARVPQGVGATTRLPTVLVLTDGTDGASEADLLTAAGFGFLVDNAVQVVMAYRGEPLVVGGDAARSQFEPDPYRADVGDVRAILGVIDRVPRTDPSRLGLVGVGRGGTVALLAAVRGASVSAVVALGAPTDLFADSFRGEVRSRLLGTTPANPYPALDALAAPAFALRDGTLDLEGARLALTRLSPARLRPNDRLPAILALHAAGDPVVGEDQLTSLDAALTSSAARPRITEIVDDVTREGLMANGTVQGRIAAFLAAEL